MNPSFCTRFLVCCFLLTGATWAQTPTGTVSGSVADSTAARVTHATVRIISLQTQEIQTTTSTDTGDYVFPSVAVGDYTLEAEATGFKVERRSGIHLDVNQNARVDFALSVGQVTEAVDVKADASQVDTRSVQLGGTVDTRRVQDLPLDGRNVYDLTALMPGVSNVVTVLTGKDEANQLNVNGQNVHSNNFYLDGAFNNLLFRNEGNMAPNPDAVEEFHLITSNFDAEYGRLPGSVMNVVTRSGGNEFHGSVFEFLRNDSVNARNFFLSSVTPLKRNQFGASVGGPIRKNKTFFFASYQGLRLQTDLYVNEIQVTSAAQRLGNFSTLAASKWPKDPSTGQVFPGGIIPASRLDPVAQNFYKMLVPLPNNPDGTFSAGVAAPVNDDQGMLKLDHQVTSSNKVSGTLFLDRSSSSAPLGNNNNSQLPVWGNSALLYSQNNVVVNDDWILSPTFLSQTRFAYTFANYAVTPLNHTSWADLGSQTRYTDDLSSVIPPQITVTGYWKGFITGTDSKPDPSYEGSQTFSWTHGSHSLKFGASLLHNNFVEHAPGSPAGVAQFTGAFTGLAPADFLLGRAASFQQNNGIVRDFNVMKYAGFIQDVWKISRRFTLNLGLRYDLDPPYTSVGNQIATVREGVQSQRYPTAPLGLVYPGDPGIPTGVIPTIYTNFVPRVGLVFDPFGNGKTAIRAGYGVFTATAQGNITSDFQAPPFQLTVVLNETPNLVNPYGDIPSGSPFPYTSNTTHPIFPNTATNVFTTSPDWGTPYVQQYNFTVQQQLSESMNVQAAFVGSVSRKLYMVRDVNAPIYIPGASTVSNVNSRRPYLPGVFGELEQYQTAENADYNSLQVTFNRRMSHGVSLLLNYTYSKSIDIGSDNLGVYLSDENNAGLDRAVSDFSTPHVLSMSWVWQAPRLTQWGLFGKEVLGGWQLSGIVTARTGMPLNILSGTDSNVDGFTTDRPDIIGNPVAPSGRSRAAQINQFFNTAAFAKAVGLDGTAGRNLIRGPASANWNVAAFKEFQIREHQVIQFRTDFFNFLNEVNLGAPNLTLTSPSFGKVTTAANGRELQFALKYRF